MTDKERFTNCFACGTDEYDSDFQEYKVKDINNKIWLCVPCRDDMVKYLNDDWIQPQRTFLARPLRRKSDSDRYAFSSAEEFEEWCTDEEDMLTEVGYTFGITVDRQLIEKETTKWLSKGKMEVKTYWLEEEDYEDRDDVEDWKSLLSQYHEGDCSFSSIDSKGAVLSLNLPAYYEFILKKAEKNKLLTQKVISTVEELRK